MQVSRPTAVTRNASARTQFLGRDREATGLRLQREDDQVNGLVQGKNARVEGDIVQVNVVGALAMDVLQVTLAVLVLHLYTRARLVTRNPFATHYIDDTLLKRRDDARVQHVAVVV